MQLRQCWAIRPVPSSRFQVITKKRHTCTDSYQLPVLTVQVLLSCFCLSEWRGQPNWMINCCTQTPVWVTVCVDCGCGVWAQRGPKATRILSGRGWIIRWTSWRSFYEDTPSLWSCFAGGRRWLLSAAGDGWESQEPPPCLSGTLQTTTERDRRQTGETDRKMNGWWIHRHRVHCKIHFFIV